MQLRNITYEDLVRSGLVPLDCSCDGYIGISVIGNPSTKIIDDKQLRALTMQIPKLEGFVHPCMTVVLNEQMKSIENFTEE